MKDKYTISKKAIIYKNGTFYGFVLHVKEENDKITIEYVTNFSDKRQNLVIDKSQLNT